MSGAKSPPSTSTRSLGATRRAGSAPSRRQRSSRARGGTATVSRCRAATPTSSPSRSTTASTSGSATARRGSTTTDRAPTSAPAGRPPSSTLRTSRVRGSASPGSTSAPTRRTSGPLLTVATLIEHNASTRRVVAEHGHDLVPAATVPKVRLRTHAESAHSREPSRDRGRGVMHTADDPDEPDHVPRFRAVIRELFASYGGWCLMGRMESDESDTTRVTVRVPTKLVEQYEEALDDDTNRSEDIRQHMREQAKQPTADGGLVPPTDDETLAGLPRTP